VPKAPVWFKLEDARPVLLLAVQSPQGEEEDAQRQEASHEEEAAGEARVVGVCTDEANSATSKACISCAPRAARRAKQQSEDLGRLSSAAAIPGVNQNSSPERSSRDRAGTDARLVRL